RLRGSGQERRHGRGLRPKLDSQSELELPASAPPLPQINEEERTRLEYHISDLSTGRHLVEFYRERMRALGAQTSAEVNQAPDGSRIRVAGPGNNPPGPPPPRRARLLPPA